MNIEVFVNNIFKEKGNFMDKAAWLFNYQYHHNIVFRKWCNLLKHDNRTPDLVNMPYLPVSFFKTHKVISDNFEPKAIFESSGTTGENTSRHYIKDTGLYERSFLSAFKKFYGNLHKWCIIGLLPSYLERNNSSLVVMTDKLIKESGHNLSGFYLYDFEKLNNTLLTLEKNQQKTLVIGVTFALLDFAEQYPMQLKHTAIMETGGMKGRKQELTRLQVHHILCRSFGLNQIHSEYGMTELMSQAYSSKEGRFYCPPSMKVTVRDEQDPLTIKTSGRGLLNIIDLANVHSCAFIATDDAGIIYEDGSFEVIGRMDNSDIRGCSLLAV